MCSRNSAVAWQYVFGPAIQDLIILCLCDYCTSRHIDGVCFRITTRFVDSARRRIRVEPRAQDHEEAAHSTATVASLKTLQIMKAQLSPRMTSSLTDSRQASNGILMLQRRVNEANTSKKTCCRVPSPRRCLLAQVPEWSLRVLAQSTHGRAQGRLGSGRELAAGGIARLDSHCVQQSYAQVAQDCSQQAKVNRPIRTAVCIRCRPR